MAAVPGSRIVRNKGPFPFIQSEGGFVEPSRRRIETRNKRYLETPNLVSPGAGSVSAADSSRISSNAGTQVQSGPCSDVLMNDYQLEAIVRLRQQLDLTRPLVPLGPRPKPVAGPPPPNDEPDDQKQDADGLPGDPFVSPNWSENLSPWDRLSAHHTLNTVRRHALMHRPFVLHSDLEFVLNSVFDQSRTLWADSNGVVLQPETVGLPTWKVLRNFRVVHPNEMLPPSPYTPPTPKSQEPEKPETPPNSSGGGGDRGHPLRYGGISRKSSPYSVKLAISGNHMSQTNAGFSRKVDGTFFS